MRIPTAPGPLETLARHAVGDDMRQALRDGHLRQVLATRAVIEEATLTGHIRYGSPTTHGRLHDLGLVLPSLLPEYRRPTARLTPLGVCVVRVLRAGSMALAEFVARARRDDQVNHARALAAAYYIPFTVRRNQGGGWLVWNQITDRLVDGPVDREQAVYRAERHNHGGHLVVEVPVPGTSDVVGLFLCHDHVHGRHWGLADVAEEGRGGTFARLSNLDAALALAVEDTDRQAGERLVAQALDQVLAEVADVLGGDAMALVTPTDPVAFTRALAAVGHHLSAGRGDLETYNVAEHGAQLRAYGCCDMIRDADGAFRVVEGGTVSLATGGRDDEVVARIENRQ